MKRLIHFRQKCFSVLFRLQGTNDANKYYFFSRCIWSLLLFKFINKEVQYFLFFFFFELKVIKIWNKKKCIVFFLSFYTWNKKRNTLVWKYSEYFDVFLRKRNKFIFKFGFEVYFNSLLNIIVGINFIELEYLKISYTLLLLFWMFMRTLFYYKHWINFVDSLFYHK